MRLMMARHPMSPLYWQSVHNALIDMVRQCGYPRLFWTKAPYEKTFPYHAFLDDQLSKQLLSRTRLPLPETLHQTRVMTEIVRGCLTGQNGRRGAWSRHLLNVPNTENRLVGRIAYMTRIEFQDGTRKKEAQDYHGTGRPHLHSIIFSEFLHTLRLDKIASAHIPNDDEILRAHVESSQLDQSYETPWQVNPEPPEWDPIAERSRLHHTQLDHDRGVRGYVHDILEATKCHEDLQ